MTGEELKAARKGAGLTQQELAAAIGMTQTDIGLMERGEAAIERRTELAVRYITGPEAEANADADVTPIDDFSRHEVLHTAHLMASMFEDFILMHRFTQSEPELKANAERIGEALADFYQLVGAKTLP